jgi:hypothetical protein
MGQETLMKVGIQHALRRKLFSLTFDFSNQSINPFEMKKYFKTGALLYQVNDMVIGKEVGTLTSFHIDYDNQIAYCLAMIKRSRIGCEVMLPLSPLPKLSDNRVGDFNSIEHFDEHRQVFSFLFGIITKPIKATFDIGQSACPPHNKNSRNQLNNNDHEVDGDDSFYYDVDDEEEEEKGDFDESFVAYYGEEWNDMNHTHLSGNNTTNIITTTVTKSPTPKSSSSRLKLKSDPDDSTWHEKEAVRRETKLKKLKEKADEFLLKNKKK